MIERADAERLDAADPLAKFRERFVIDDPETIISTATRSEGCLWPHASGCARSPASGDPTS